MLCTGATVCSRLALAIRLLTAIILLSSGSLALAVDPPYAPNEQEQFSLQLINRARADQVSEATRFGLAGDYNEGLHGDPLVTITAGFKQPLAFDLSLNQVAENYSDYLLQNNFFFHNDDRIPHAIAAGYTGVTDNSGFLDFCCGTLGENLARYTYTPSTLISRIADQHEGLFVDEDWPGRGHRAQMLQEGYQLIGIGIEISSSPSANIMQTQNFGTKPGSRFLTGVVFTDQDSDLFYTPDNGEALGGYTIEAIATDSSGTLSTTTWASGGYSLELDPTKEYNLAIKDPTGALIEGSSMTLAPDTLNFEYSSMNPAAVPEPSSLALGAMAAFAMLGLVLGRKRLGLAA